MPDLHLKCRSCGLRFVWTEKEQAEFEANAPDPQADLQEVEEHCKSCRPKQDGQRS